MGKNRYIFSDDNALFVVTITRYRLLSLNYKTLSPIPKSVISIPLPPPSHTNTHCAHTTIAATVHHCRRPHRHRLRRRSVAGIHPSPFSHHMHTSTLSLSPQISLCPDFNFSHPRYDFTLSLRDFTFNACGKLECCSHLLYS